VVLGPSSGLGPGLPGNAYVPILQSSGQVGSRSWTQYLDLPIPSPGRCWEKISQRFPPIGWRPSPRPMDIPWVKFGKDDRKADGDGPVLKAGRAAGGRSGWRRSAWRRSFPACGGPPISVTPKEPRAPQFHLPLRADRRVTCYYFYLWDAGFGPAFHQGLFPTSPIRPRFWVNGNEVGQSGRHSRPGSRFTELSQRLLRPARDPGAACRRFCDRLQPGTIEVVRSAVAAPGFPDAVRAAPTSAAGYWWGDLHAARSRLVPPPWCFDAPPPRPGRSSRALIADNPRTSAAPPTSRFIFQPPTSARDHSRRVPHCDRPAGPSARTAAASCSNLFLQALADQSSTSKDGRANADRGTVIKRNPATWGCKRPGLPQTSKPLQAKARRRQPPHYWKLNVPAQGTVPLRAQPLRRIAHPSADAGRAEGPRPLRFWRSSGPWPWAGALCTTLLRRYRASPQQEALRALMTGLLHTPYTPGQMTYDLRRATPGGAHPPDSSATNRYVPHPGRRQSRDLLHQAAPTGSCARCWPPTSPRHPPNSALPCAPSTTRSRATSPAARLSPGRVKNLTQTSRNPRRTKDR